MDDVRAQSLEALKALLFSRNNQAAYAACQALEALCEESDAPYRYAEDFARLLDSPRSLKRDRELALVARWDRSGLVDGAIGKYLACLRDPKPITVRQCFQHMPMLAQSKPQLQQQWADVLANADFSGYMGSMLPLLEKDRQTVLANMLMLLAEMHFGNTGAV